MANPVLIEVTRGNLVESQHRGAVAILDPAGGLVLSLGDIEAPVFPRSAVKIMQAIPLLTSGAAETYGFGPCELALACSSHNGEPRQVGLAAAMLARAGLDASALECGAHAPGLERANHELILAGQRPTALHNNCSGKHAGMLAVAQYLGEPPAGYARADHPVQQRIAGIMARLTGATPVSEVCGVDGCSVPTWALPLAGWARAFAKFTCEDAGSADVTAARKLIAACMAEPYFVAGEKRFCTEVMAAACGAVFVKTGAEGVFCGALPGKELGIAIKIDDGATRASEAVMAGVLGAIVPGLAGFLERWTRKPVRTVMGATAGMVRLEDAFARGLRRLETFG